MEDYKAEFTKATNNITFKGKDNKIGGNVTATTQDYEKSVGTNTITFEQDGAIGGNVSAAGGSGTSRGNNTITFEKDGTATELPSSILECRHCQCCNYNINLSC